MSKYNGKNVESRSEEEAAVTTWVLSTKRVGDKVAGWVIESLEEDNVRCLEVSERCEVTSFCYPTGARVMRAQLSRPS